VVNSSSAYERRMSVGRVVRTSLGDGYQCTIPLYIATQFIATDRAGGVPDRDARMTKTWRDYFAEMDSACEQLVGGGVVKTSKAEYRIVERKKDVHLSRSPGDSSGRFPDRDSCSDHGSQVAGGPMGF